MGHGGEHGLRKLKLVATPVISRTTSIATSQQDTLDGQNPHGQQRYDAESAYPHQINDAGMHYTPEFERHEEATNIELFYDLFFVANLTTFTGIHEINESHALISYAGFFCLLWFTWCQVGLFDVRYVTDSILERIAKACQFGVMVGFAVVGPNFDPTNQKQSTFRALSVILAVSRFVLSFQYLMIMFHVKNYRRSKTPLGLLSLLNFVAAMIYLGVTFAFKKDGNSNVYITWYVVAVVETAINIVISSKWKVVSFKGTHLVQRMSLLTLIILGEGIIVVCKSISKIVKNQFAWSPGTIGSITAIIAIIYLLYMLYFDWLSHQHFGSVRQQIWAFLHFPFHLSLVLAMEGGAQFVIWRKLVEVIGLVENEFVAAIDPLDINKLNQTTELIFSLYPPTYTKTYYEAENALAAVAAAKDDHSASTAVVSLFATIQNSLFTTYGIVLPKDKKASEEASSLSEAETFLNVFVLVIIYFFVTIGLTLVIMNLLNYLSISHKSRGKLSKGTWLRLFLITIIGLALGSLAALSATDAGDNFATSPWLLPTVALALGIAFVINNIRRDKTDAKIETRSDAKYAGH